MRSGSVPPGIDVVANAREVKTANARERNVPGAGADLGLNGDEQRRAFEFLANGVGRSPPVDAPPLLGSANLCPSEVSDLDVKRPPHSRLLRVTRVVFATREAFFLRRRDDLAVDDEGGSAVVIERRDSEDRRHQRRWDTA